MPTKTTTTKPKRRAKACRTYAESKRRKPFDWNRFLSPRTERTLAMWGRARKLSGEWVTCACGNQCDAIPRAPYGTGTRQTGAPLDETLHHLGCEFHVHIAREDSEGARDVLYKIERRSTQILKDLHHT